MPIPPTLPNGTQKGKEKMEGGEPKRLLAHTFKVKLGLHHGNLASFLSHVGDVDYT